MSPWIGDTKITCVYNFTASLHLQMHECFVGLLVHKIIFIGWMRNSSIYKFIKEKKHYNMTIYLYFLELFYNFSHFLILSLNLNQILLRNDIFTWEKSYYRIVVDTRMLIYFKWNTWNMFCMVVFIKAIEK
jgi:hypothetical protein